ncbi:hypothetical protein JOB18_003947 [Solea senegalensis]|uniref:Uncharacterized protein n=1 Tax=Solea senegalensis TaxID=28829 RepID=A0AAV6QJQ6_SOLSE|nr:hypothetical protein JOB18_003947 [Solea senegalensis]
MNTVYTYVMFPNQQQQQQSEQTMCDTPQSLEQVTAVKRPVSPLSGVCPHSLAALTLSSVALSVIWRRDLYGFTVTYAGCCSSPDP